MKGFSALVLVALAFLAVDAYESVHRGLPVADPLRTISDAEAKELKPVPADKKAKKIIQPKEAGKLQTVNKQVFGGYVSSRGQSPWQVFIVQDGTYMCGGSLILPQWVMTAAQCASGRSNFSLTFGAFNRSAFESGRIIVETNMKFVHPNYNSANFNNDIALIRLPLPLFQTSTNFITPIRLPLLTDAILTMEGYAVIAGGWGGYNNTLNKTEILVQLNMSVISNTKCASFYATNVVKSSTICTNSSSGASVCSGDIGGPLVYYDTFFRAWTQIGITSFVSANGSCVAGYPDGFTRVTAYLGWISTTVAANVLAG